ncbi:MAG: tripartite tricarboxylate transporter permease, partial [Deltaproteobacteria bacterium]|nr:tripartite tricarboxylate transporter permease [Deltaproteobacteria bacterium]
ANIITVAVCFLFLNQLAKITNIRGTLLIPFLLLLIYLGGFTVKNSFGDMIMVLIFGALGWLMVQFDWQRPSLLVGLVLGTITERNFWISTRAYGAGWLMHPGVLIIALLIVGAIIYSIRQILREKARLSEAGPESATETQMGIFSSPVYRPVFALFFVGIFIYVLRETFFEIRPVEEGAALFPMVIGIPTLALALLAFGQELYNSIHIRARRPNPSQNDLGPAVVRRRTISIIGWTLGFFLAIWLLGFNIGVLLSTFLYLRWGGGEKWPITITLTIVGWLFLYGVFDYFLHIPFPEGEIFLWLE